MQASTIPHKPFGRVRNFLWPIHKHEHRKLLPMLALFFLISFIYNVLRCMKVTIVVTAEGSGAEVIPFLKWVVLPTAVLIAYLYTKLSNWMTREKVFYAMLVIFLGFFAVFLLVLHPNQEALELKGFAEFLQSRLPESLKGMIAVIRHWPLSLFYVISEMWSAVVLSMLFWGFANEVTSVDEAKRFYAIFAIGANFSGIFSGQSAQLLTLQEYNPLLPFGKEAWEQSLMLQLGIVLIMGVLIIVLFRWVNRSVLPRYSASMAKNYPMSVAAVKEKEETKKLSLYECFSYLAKSRYMVYITILVVAYNIVYNLSDVLWTDQIKQHYPKAQDFNAYINQVASITGIFATLSGLILSGNVIRRYGWTVTAMITPLLWLFTSIGFLGCMLFENSHWVADTLYAIFHMPIYTLILSFGSAQICLGRSAKYTVFDETKEIAFIPLPSSEQRKGKAVVDGIASRFGKSGGALLMQLMIISCGELALTIPYVAIVFLIVLIAWIWAVRNLGGMVSQSIDSTPRTAPVPAANHPSSTPIFSSKG